MYVLIGAIIVMNLIMGCSAVQYLALKCRKSRLDPELEKYCVGQYYAMVGYYHSRLIHEYNEKFLPNSDEKIKLKQYQEFLKKLRKKTVSPSDFVNVAEEIYTPPGTPTLEPTESQQPIQSISLLEAQIDNCPRKRKSTEEVIDSQE